LERETWILKPLISVPNGMTKLSAQAKWKKIQVSGQDSKFCNQKSYLSISSVRSRMTKHLDYGRMEKGD
jgi:hypothetical protein